MIPASERERVIRETATFPAHTLSPAQETLLEGLLRGFFAPLQGFMGQADYNSVLAYSTLANGTPWALPVCLAIPDPAAYGEPGTKLLLRDEEGTPLAILAVEEVWKTDPAIEAQALYGSADPEHPGVASIVHESPWRIAGKVIGIQFPRHYDFVDLRPESTPHGPFSGFWATHPLTAAAEQTLLNHARNAGLPFRMLVSSGCDMLEPMPTAARVRLFRPLLARSTKTASTLHVIPLERQVGSLRDLSHRLQVLANMGGRACVVDAGTESEAALAHAQGFAQALGIHLTLMSSETATLFSHLQRGEVGPGFMPEDETLLRQLFPPRSQQGVVLFFTGLSGAGKSTVAKALYGALANYNRSVTLLDGDIVRLNLSKGLGFSKEDRDLNIRRIGYVASLIAKSGGLAICAPIAPYRKTRADVRQMVSHHGRFVEVHVATDLATCEGRDPKGLYARARSGQLKGFTGIDDPYEEPLNPELRLDTGRLSVDQSLEQLLGWLSREGYLV